MFCYKRIDRGLGVYDEQFREFARTVLDKSETEGSSVTVSDQSIDDVEKAVTSITGLPAKRIVPEGELQFPPSRADPPLEQVIGPPEKNGE